jgi:hypothetical protein
VSHRKAPGAMSAIAFIVNPVKPKVACISGALLSAMENPLFFGWGSDKAVLGATGLVLQHSGLPFALPIDSFY